MNNVHCNKFSMNFSVKKEGLLFDIKKDKKQSAFCTFEEETLNFEVFYSFNETVPLRLSSKAKIGDDVRITVLPYRIELYVNGVLCDEEWPCGNHAFPKKR